MLARILYRHSHAQDDAATTVNDVLEGAKPAVQQRVKSRNGCKTCKTRHVKCDEQKPNCARCVKAGIECDGYLTPEARKVAAINQKAHNKSRMGCTTCKARKVKCDELKPSCSWCIKSNKVCHYPLPAPAAIKQNRQVVASRPLLPRINNVETIKLNLVPGTNKEKHSFEFYIIELSDMPVSSFDAEFWTRILVQRCIGEPALWHALVSLSMVVEIRAKERSRSISYYDKSTTLSGALQHYNKAIRLSSMMVTPRNETNMESLVINSVLFSLFEIVLLDAPKASLHLFGGIKLINSWKLENSNPRPEQKDLFHDFLIPILDYMESLSMMYDACTAYGVLRDDINSFVSNITPSACNPNNPEYEKAILRKAKLQDRSDKCMQALQDAMSTSSAVDPTEEEADGAALMQFWFSVLQIRLHTALSQNEMEYDDYQVAFKQSIECAKVAIAIIRTKGKKLTTSLLPLHSGMPMLFWLAWKCRDATLRQEAISLLKDSWDLFMFEGPRYWTKVIERVVQLESHSTVENAQMVPPDPVRIYGIKVIPAGELTDGKAYVLLSYKLRRDVAKDPENWIHEMVAV